MNNAQIKAIREIATKSTAYAFILKFTREFTSGSLKGTTHEDSIGFCKAVDCDECQQCQQGREAQLQGH